MDTLEAIRKRRSIRRYTGASIPRQDIETIVDAARWAASGYNRQVWDFADFMMASSSRRIPGSHAR
jgi:nitroreductase